jgi:hypothetical protein
VESKKKNGALTRTPHTLRTYTHNTFRPVLSPQSATSLGNYVHSCPHVTGHCDVITLPNDTKDRPHKLVTIKATDTAIRVEKS